MNPLALAFVMRKVISDTTLRIPVIDGRNAEWDPAVKHLIELGKNFLIILCDKPQEHQKLKNCIGNLPRPQEKWETLSLSPVIETPDAVRLSQAHASEDSVFFIEMVKVPDNRPPKFKNFIAYCELRGIIGHADSLEEVKELCSEHVSEIQQQTEYQESKIYEWRGDQWVPLSINC